jgi:putative intracellular protease/amidase
MKNGAHYFKANNWNSFTEQDGLLITGQNPASSEAGAELLLKTLLGNK